MSSTDQELIDRILRGGSSDFRTLVERHSPGALELAERMLGRRVEAEEAVQDAFVRVYRSLDGFRRDSSFSTWFYRIVYNVCLTRRARRKKPPTVPFDEMESGSAASTGSNGLHRPDRIYDAWELQHQVDRAIERIPDVYRGVFTLFFSQEMSYEEIAEITGLPVNTVKTRLFRARTILRENVRTYLEEGAVGATKHSDVKLQGSESNQKKEAQ